MPRWAAKRPTIFFWTISTCWGRAGGAVLCRLAYRLPENVHLIVASRNRFLPGEQVVRLGRRLHRIEADGLRLNREELLAYTHRCGVEITAAQAESLLRSCGGSPPST